MIKGGRLENTIDELKNHLNRRTTPIRAAVKWMTKNNYTAFNRAALLESGIFKTSAV